MNVVQKFLPQISVVGMVAAPFAVAPCATAQFAAYNTLALSNRVSNESNQDPHFTSAGMGVGVYYDGHRLGRISLGADVRGSISANDKLGLFGLRVALQPRATHKIYVPVRPYAEVLLGGGTTTDISQNQKAHLIYEGVLGVDCLVGHFDYRLFEMGIGRTPFENSMGASYTGGNLWLLTESSGIVYHF